MLDSSTPILSSPPKPDRHTRCKVVGCTEISIIAYHINESDGKICAFCIQHILAHCPIPNCDFDGEYKIHNMSVSTSICGTGGYFASGILITAGVAFAILFATGEYRIKVG